MTKCQIFLEKRTDVLYDEEDIMLPCIISLTVLAVVFRKSRGPKTEGISCGKGQR